ncbi:hypothetical protein M0805_008207 [Coniferiporia weirii]|nr:hypothetical protein M0805_008207 [Coniferiporia weirii]
MHRSLESLRLAYLHDNGVVHSYLKSKTFKDDVLVSSSGNAVICDFGISRAMNATQTALGGNITAPNGPTGTDRWMAYELVAETEKYKKHLKEWDVWAFGMTVYEPLVKGRPYAQITIEFQNTLAVIRKQLPSRPASLGTCANGAGT